MFEKWRIKKHMEVTDSVGQHVGIVDDVEDNRIKLTRSDSSDSSHHYLDLDAVDKIDENRVYLREGTPLPFERGTIDATAGTEARTAAPVGMATGRDPSGADVYGGTDSASAIPTDNPPLFGTSGHGTGIGGSGTNG